MTARAPSPSPARGEGWGGGGAARAGVSHLAALLALAWAGGALAQTELLPGYPDRAALGAEAAKGAVIWNHGLSLVAETPSDPPFFVDFLQDAGWDVFRLQRRWAGDNLADSSAALVEAIGKMHSDGYKRVVLAGQSFGAWMSYNVATRPDVAVDAIVAAAPARYGSEGTSTNWTLNAERLYSLAAAVKSTRVMTFLFDKDSYDPGGRGPVLDGIFKQQKLPAVVIDRPAGFEGHGAASSQAFAHSFGPCVVAFVEIAAVPPEFTCKDYPVAPPEFGFRLPANLKVNPPTQAATAFAPYSGRWFGLSPTGRALMLIVYQMGFDRALAVYAWTAATRSATDKPGATSRRGEFIPETGALRFTEPKLQRLEAKLRPDGRLDFSIDNPEPTGKPIALVMRRLD